MSLILRQEKGSKLTIIEMDDNLTYLEGLSLSGGTDGTSGSSGTSGTNGTSGSSGTSATNGTSGSSGTSGTNGTSGSSGTSGTNGTSGSSGTSATNGTSGTSGTSGTGSTYDELYYDDINHVLYVDNVNLNYSGLTGLIDSLDWEFTNVSTTGQTYILDLYAEYNYKIITIRLQGDAGTGVTNFYINSNIINELSGITFNSDIQSYQVTTSNIVNIGDQIKFIITGLNDSPSLIRGKMKTIRI